MFTGIIRAVAKVKMAKKKKGSLFLTFEKPRGWKVRAGDSIATDGVCLTVREVMKNEYITELMPQTLKVSSFGEQIPKEVNLEPSLKQNSRLDGHMVLGHVDAVGNIKNIQSQNRQKLMTIGFPKEYSHLVVPKGSIAVDGISLTVVDTKPGWFSTALVDYTLRHATLGKKKVGDLVNIEFDIIAKYLLQ